jgi:protein arginine kinase activator
MQQFIHGMKKEIHLCQECTFKLDNPEMLMSLENIFKGFLDQLQTKYPFAPGSENGFMPRPSIACARCGMTYDEFKASGKLGCEICYQSFSGEVEALLKNVHGSTRHEGKYPRRLGPGHKHKRRVDELRAQLKKAVAEENYEEAARLRDEIRASEQPQEQPQEAQEEPGGVAL